MTEEQDSKEVRGQEEKHFQVLCHVGSAIDDGNGIETREIDILSDLKPDIQKRFDEQKKDPVFYPNDFFQANKITTNDWKEKTVIATGVYSARRDSFVFWIDKNDPKYLFDSKEEFDSHKNKKPIYFEFPIRRATNSDETVDEYVKKNEQANYKSKSSKILYEQNDNYTLLLRNSLKDHYSRFTKIPFSDAMIKDSVYISGDIAFIPSVQRDEEQFLNDFIQESKNENLYYREKDLINFHTAMKTSGLVVLAGLSGTGKSQLVKCYGNALKIRDNVKFIPVRSNWTDDSDLLGYYNPQTKEYNPGNSGLIETLSESEKNPGQLYIVVFDEMNLAKVEHYFAQFLSVLEMDKGQRLIHLYDGKDSAKNGIKSDIAIRDNVLFVGTVNTDESTYKFSDKVLDRSNVIKLSMVPFTELHQNQQHKKIDSQSVSYDQFASFQKSNDDIDLKSSELKLLQNINNAINQADRNTGIGWRIVKQIGEYLDNLPDAFSKEIDRQKGLDLQINQRVLTKIRGSEEQLSDLLGVDGKESTLQKVLDEFDSQGFVESKQTIKAKARDLEANGFTI